PNGSSVVFDQTTRQPIINLVFTDEGADKFYAITSRNVGKPLAIFLDDSPLQVATVQQAISGGQAQISGSFALPEAQETVRLLNAGALPVPLNLKEQRIIGATLGQESIQRSLVAGAVGLILVAGFMILYYRLLGFVAVLSLLLYTIFSLAIFKLIPVTLTLAGITGFILSIGMAVDANILIFERLKEELREGKSLRRAIEEGFSRAWSSIRDSNASSVMTALILYNFGSSVLLKDSPLHLLLEFSSPSLPRLPSLEPSYTSLSELDYFPVAIKIPEKT
ncbi:MAG TPA: protein translocase subunit SecD, partial [Patescibacteria group bacterium]